MSVLQKKLPKGADKSDVALLSEMQVLSEVKEWISTGFPNVDRSIGGGFAVGRISEVFGPEGSGKTALAHMAIRSCQEQGGIVVLFDFEGELTPQRMDQYGINREQLIYVRPDHAEQAWDMIFDTLDTLKAEAPDAPFLFIWDSIAMTPSKTENEHDSAEDQHHGGGGVPKVMSVELKRVVKPLQKVRAHILFINQERDKMGGTKYDEPVTPGGRQVKYVASQRIRVNAYKFPSAAKRPKGTPPTGLKVYVGTRKCRLCPPFQQTEYYIDFKLGPSPELSALYALREAGVLKMSGSYLKAPWYDGSFYAKEWMDLMEADDDFYDGAMEAYAELSRDERTVSPDED